MNADVIKLLQRIATAQDAGTPLIADDLTTQEVWDFNVSLDQNLVGMVNVGIVDELVVTLLGRSALTEREKQS